MHRIHQAKTCQYDLSHRATVAVTPPQDSVDCAALSCHDVVLYCFLHEEGDRIWHFFLARIFRRSHLSTAYFTEVLTFHKKYIFLLRRQIIVVTFLSEITPEKGMNSVCGGQMRQARVTLSMNDIVSCTASYEQKVLKRTDITSSFGICSWSPVQCTIWTDRAHFTHKLSHRGNITTLIAHSANRSHQMMLSTYSTPIKHAFSVSVRTYLFFIEYL